MKFILALILCSYTAGTCLPPYVYPTKFEDQYDCFVEGYKQSMVKMEEIGREDINEHEIYTILYTANTAIQNELSTIGR